MDFQTKIDHLHKKTDTVAAFKSIRASVAMCRACFIVFNLCLVSREIN